jgi:hypothetical protein
MYILADSLYSSTVERDTVNILIYVQFILRAYKRVNLMVEYCVSATKVISSSLIHVYVFMLWL